MYNNVTKWLSKEVRVTTFAIASWKSDNWMGSNREFCRGHEKLLGILRGKNRFWYFLKHKYSIVMV